MVASGHSCCMPCSPRHIGQHASDGHIGQHTHPRPRQQLVSPCTSLKFDSNPSFIGRFAQQRCVWWQHKGIGVKIVIDIQLLQSCPPKKLSLVAISNGSIIAPKNCLLFCHVQRIIGVTIQHRQENLKFLIFKLFASSSYFISNYLGTLHKLAF